MSNRGCTLLPLFYDKVVYGKIKKIGDYLRGFLLYGLIDGAYTEKRYLDELFMLGTFGRLIGFPGLFNYYYLRLTPYCVKGLYPWKRRLLRERDFFDHIKD